MNLKMSIDKLAQLITKEFTPQVLDGILKKYSGLEDVKIDELKIGAASKKGDSYLSTVTRFSVKFTGKDNGGQEEKFFLPIIVKALPNNVARTKTFRSAEFFRNEDLFYKNVWSAYQQFQSSKNTKDKFDNIPTFLASHIDGTNDFIAMVDLSYAGYGNAERVSGLNLENSLVILDLFARFHGLGLALKDQDRSTFEKAALSLEETYFSENQRKWYLNFLTNHLVPILRDAVQKELPPEYLEKLNQHLSGDYFGRICKICEDHSSPLAVVTHGDAWLPNFLFKPDHVVMIDFQLARYASLANDILFFIFACIDFALLEKHWDELLAKYHQSLCDTLERYGSSRDLVSLEAIHDEVKKCITFGTGMSLEALVMSMLDDDEVSDLDLIQGEDAVPIETAWLIYPMKDQAKRRRLAGMIKLAVDKKFI